MKKFYLTALTLVFGAALTACSTMSPVYTDGKATQVAEGRALTLGLDKEDFENAADAMIQSMLRDPAFATISPNSRKVIAIGRIVNDTPQRIETDKLVSKITIALRKSGKFVLTTAVAAGGARDGMSKSVRELREDEEFNQATIAKKGTLVAPDFSLAGKIRQESVKLPNGKVQVEYYFYLSVTDLTSGLAYWEDEKTISKLGDKKSVSW